MQWYICYVQGYCGVHCHLFSILAAFIIWKKGKSTGLNVQTDIKFGMLIVKRGPDSVMVFLDRNGTYLNEAIYAVRKMWYFMVGRWGYSILNVERTTTYALCSHVRSFVSFLALFTDRFRDDEFAEKPTQFIILKILHECARLHHWI